MKAASTKPTILFCDLGRAPYGDVWDLQRRIQAATIDAKRAAAPLEENVVLLVEHPPVYTLGKSGSEAHLIADESTLGEIGAELVRIDRGGDITYHGPGQLVVYPILDLDRFFTDIHRYMRSLEDCVIRVCSDLGVDAGRVEGLTGVWVGPPGHERKICALGVKCSRWVTMHGLALNVSTNLSRFDHIIPCGIQDRGVTSLSLETGTVVPLQATKALVIRHFCDVFDVRASPGTPEEAVASLPHILGTGTVGVPPAAS